MSMRLIRVVNQVGARCYNNKIAKSLEALYVHSLVDFVDFVALCVALIYCVVCRLHHDLSTKHSLLQSLVGHHKVVLLIRRYFQNPSMIWKYTICPLINYHVIFQCLSWVRVHDVAHERWRAKSSVVRIHDVAHERWRAHLHFILFSTYICSNVPISWITPSQMWIQQT